MSNENETPEETLKLGRYLCFKRRGPWEYVERVNCTGVAVIVPLTDDAEIVLVEQFRVPVRTSVIELPAGLVGDDPTHDGENLTAAAGRELIEETGFEATTIERLCVGPPSSGLAGELIDLCLATGLRRVGPGGGVHDEQITVHVVPLDTVDSWLNTRAENGTLIDPKIYAGLYFARHHSP